MTAETKELRTEVQSVRDEAVFLARKLAINSLLNEVYYRKLDIDALVKDNEEYAKTVNRVQYKLSILDTNDPDYARKTKDLEQELEDTVKQADVQTANNEKRIIQKQKYNLEADDKIKKIEDGETKMDFEFVRELIEKILMKREWIKVFP